MKDKEQGLIPRRSLVTGMSVAAAGLAVAASSTTSAQPSSTSTFEPARYELDAWMGELPGDHRVFIDTSTAQGGADALRYGFNILSAQESAYDGSASDYAMIICYRHFSTPFGFNDSIWEKYGEQFQAVIGYSDPATGEAATVNLLNAGNGPTTIDSMAAQGIQFAICASATRFFAGQLARTFGTNTEDVIAELQANAITNSRFVSAGVMAMTRAQEYSYSLLYAG